MEQSFRKLIEASQKIFIASHISPDGDAISSILLLGSTLRLNYPNKQVIMALEERPARTMDFLAAYKDISFGNIFEQLRISKPDAFIIVDAMECERVSRNQGVMLRELLKTEGINVIVIDHHASAGKEKADIYINNGLAATTHELYKLLFDDLELIKPTDYQNYVLLGLITDTQRFKHHNPHHRETFNLISKLLDEGASIETLDNKLNQYTIPQMRVLSVLAKNATDSGKGYSYSYVNDDFNWHEGGYAAEYASGCEIFINNFIRNLEGNTWGFVIYPDKESGAKNYSASFRSVAGKPDVSLIAEKLGGGGHMGAAGAKRIEADTTKEAVELVEAAIRSVLSS